jgi:hypothetical protein
MHPPASRCLEVVNCIAQGTSDVAYGFTLLKTSAARMPELAGLAVFRLSGLG